MKKKRERENEKNRKVHICNCRNFLIGLSSLEQINHERFLTKKYYLQTLFLNSFTCNHSNHFRREGSLAKSATHNNKYNNLNNNNKN